MKYQYTRKQVSFLSPVFLTKLKIMLFSVCQIIKIYILLTVFVDKSVDNLLIMYCQKFHN